VDGRGSKHTLKSAQETGILHLATEPGHHRYEITDVGDAHYAESKASIVLEHDIHSRPSASFVRQNTQSLCLDQQLASDARVRLQGKAPFILTLAVRKIATPEVATHRVSVDSNEWTLKLPYTVEEVGKHEIAIVAVSDASGCDMIVYEGDRLITTVDVVETASIVPVGHKEDLCVGDTLEFILQGKAEWTIG
jgi:nucleoporin POM152